MKRDVSVGFWEEEQRDLTHLLYSITLAVQLKVDPKKVARRLHWGCVFRVEPQYDEGLDVRGSEKEMNEE